MDITNIINPLNDAQRQAVSAPLKPILVLAGAGSGKTRVLVHRIAWLIQVEGVSPHSILAVTFTNKAAAEMRTRVESLLGISARSMWIGTFHGLAHRLLRRHAQQAGLPESFQVMDSDDQLRVIKRILKSLNLDDARWPPKQAQWYINAQKDEGVRARHMAETGDFYLSQMRAVYRMYEDICKQSGLVDFAELLLRAHELLRDIPDVLAFYQARFLHVLVDEFQDTNTIQYAWLRLLTGGKDNLFVVGDDDQSIYGWRGAKIENIYQFQQHYPEHKVIKLEQNYRSTGHILKAANHVIARNEGRMGKELWTDSGLGDLISLYSAFNEQDEAYFVVERIRKWVNEGGARSEVAILYRSNAQSRQFEERLMNTGTPYRVYGGLRFFERAEVKNALAYLRLIANAEDDASFERVVNTPARGIGAKALDDLRLFARDQRLSLWQATEALIAQQRLTPRASGALAGFLKLIGKMAAETSSLPLFEKVKKVVEHSGLIELYQKEKGDKGEARVENLEELVNAAKAYVFDQDNEEQMGELDMFLAHAALESGDMQGDDFEDCVQLMTLHSAKGLEFNLVFVVGMEEGLFPSQQSVEDAGRLEEERRLCYVGMTRAKKQLILTYAESRRIYGRETNPRPSRFLKEIPADTLQEVRLRAQVSRPVTAVSTLSDANRASASFRLGQRVKHEKFGEGVVLQIDGSGDQERAQINFSDAGMKWLMLAYANLQRLH
ncbi:MAG: DNA helicase II [Methylicorpusculum sp.]|uniref:DNA helicase II n=1 Tax=Methylicorpusculum sp. TaxID=2713644 RepID=UPI00272FA2CD|nr:DNA helicase II [Methylicorpusculum sp.]MDP2180335.1 DNA helicase II [Methylicorpusculum sp.]